MKLLSFQHKDYTSYGIYTEFGIIDLAKRFPKNKYGLRGFLQEYGVDKAEPFKNEKPDFQHDEIKYLPVINNPNKILCVGMNYNDKRIEFGATSNAPTIFIRFPDSQTAHLDHVIKPRFTEQLDYEGELVVIIGKHAEQIPIDEASDYIAGYSCYMDGSIRDWQHTWFTAGKNWKKTGSFGPWLITKDEIPNPQSLDIKTWLNGSLVQDANTSYMVHKIPELISYISTFTSLEPGDVILTGSPGGVGKSRIPPLYMNHGDVVEVEIEKIGKLTNHIISADFL